MVMDPTLPRIKVRDLLMQAFLTGWERSNLGPALAERGAEIGPDLYPAQNFFRRSDNYQLALKGVVAQTISAWPLPPTYHQPTDTIENLDLAFMALQVGAVDVGVECQLIGGASRRRACRVARSGRASE